LQLMCIQKRPSFYPPLFSRNAKKKPDNRQQKNPKKTRTDGTLS